MTVERLTRSIEPSPDQRPARVRLEWGLTGALQLLGPDGSASLVVVVDVLSFSTAVTVACEQGVASTPTRTATPPVPTRSPDGSAPSWHGRAGTTGSASRRPRCDG